MIGPDNLDDLISADEVLTEAINALVVAVNEANQIVNDWLMNHGQPPQDRPYFSLVQDRMQVALLKNLFRK